MPPASFNISKTQIQMINSYGSTNHPDMQEKNPENYEGTIWFTMSRIVVSSGVYFNPKLFTLLVLLNLSE